MYSSPLSRLPVTLTHLLRSSICVAVAAMVLVNPSEMAKAVQYAAEQIDETESAIDIFVVDKIGTTTQVSYIGPRRAW